MRSAFLFLAGTCGTGFQPARRFEIGVGRGSRSRAQDAVLPHNKFWGAAVLFLTCAALVWAQKKPITLETMEEASRLAPQGPGNPLAWSPEGQRFLYRQGRRLVIYDPATGSSKDLADTSAMDSAAVRAESVESRPFAWENRRVRETPVQWAAGEVLYSTGGDVFLIRVDTGKWTQLTKTPVAERDPKLSPDGTSVAFRRGWDLYNLDIASKRETRLTTGGSETLRNGGLDWVYPEELDLGTAYWWSPDSKSIVYLQSDLSHEPIYPHEDLRGPRPIYEPQRYPQAGENNPDVRVGVVGVRGGNTRWMDVRGTHDDTLIARVGWTPDSRNVYLVRTNRVQNKLDLLLAEAGSGKTSRMLEESDKYWVNVPDNPVFVNGGRQFLWLSERDGFRHLYLYSVNGKESRQLTRGSWEVTGIAGVDEPAGKVYYTASETSPLERQIYSIGMTGEGKQQLSSGAGTHSIAMGPGGHFYLDTFSSLSPVAAPPRTTVYSGDGREIGVYREQNRSLEEYEILPTELVNFKAADGTLLYARLIKPKGFEPGKTYPAVVLVYGGPDSQGVRNAWMGVDLDQVLASRGFVVWQVDNRGSSGRGHAFETPVYHKLGEIELADQVAGVEHLVSLGFVDRSRIGIRGWSYGGFMTLNAMLNASGVFRAGIAGAPVTDWRNYDTIYTERYMGLPKDNPEGYRSTALPAKAKNLKGKLMVAHNVEDDNVLFQNTVQLVDALEREGKPFEMQVYTQKTHAVTGAEARQLNATMVDFFERTLR
ncbi:MAG TPA: S9 family peptidase [Bryobacteraceae bacterium]|jgi:dipeptidyl-peptidase-4|nr:S9 family peptidase [Bryobacteraceae bacterium]